MRIQKAFRSRKFRYALIKYTVILSVVLLMLLFRKQTISIIVTIGLILLGSLSKLYKRFTNHSIGFELITFITVLFFFSHGFIFGIIAAFIMNVLGFLVNGRFSTALVVQMVSYILIGLFSLVLHPLDFSVSAKILIVLYNIVSFILFLMLGSNPARGFTIVVNIMVNFFLINHFGLYMLNLLS